jgi:hypothetical protein
MTIVVAKIMPMMSAMVAAAGIDLDQRKNKIVSTIE